MSKQDEHFVMSAKLEFRTDTNSAIAFEKALSDNVRASERVSVSAKREDGNLFISIDAKDTSILRAIIDNYLSAIKTLEEINKL